MLEELILTSGGFLSGLLALGGFFKWQGDEEITLMPDAIKKTVIKASQGCCELNFEIPLVNRGKQNGMLMEIFAQPAYQGSAMEKIQIVPRFRIKNAVSRSVWYWEAVIIKKKTYHELEGSILFYYPGNLKELIREMPRFTLVTHLKTVGRSRIDLKVTELKFDLKEILESGDGPLKLK